MVWILPLLLLLSAMPALAATRYAAPGGSGSTCSQATPCSFATGVNQTVAGDTLLVRGGNYNIPLGSIIPNSGTNWNNTVTIKSFGTEVPVFAPRFPVNFGNPGNLRYIVLDGLTFDGQNTGTNFDFGISQGNGPIRIIRCTLRRYTGSGFQVTSASTPGTQIIDTTIEDVGTDGFNHGMYITASEMLIEGNTVRRTQGGGIKIGQGGNATNNIVRNNFVSDWALSGITGAGYGIAGVDGSTNTQFYNNVMFNCNNQTDNDDSAALYVWRGTGNVYYQNTATDLGPCWSIYISPHSANSSVRNNILDGPGKFDPTTPSGLIYNTNHCASGLSGSGCSTTGNPQFVNAPAGNFHLQAGSPAASGGATLGSPFNVDIENVSRPIGLYSKGAYQFTSAPPPSASGNVARWRFEEGTGLTAADSEVGTGPGGHTLTLNTAGWTTGLVDLFALNANGARWGTATATADLQPVLEGGLSAWIKPTALPASNESVVVALPGDGMVMGLINNAGVNELICYVVINGTFETARGGSIPFGTAQHVSCSYKDGDGIRARVANVQVDFQAMSGPIDYSKVPAGTRALQVGRSDFIPADYIFSGVIDQVYIYDTEISDALNTTLFQEAVPTTGMALTHMALYAGNAVEGLQIGATDTNLSVPLINPAGLRGSIHKGDVGTITEYFRPFCRTNTGAGFPPWTSAVEVTNGFGSLGIRYLADSVITQGQTSTRLLPLDGFTGVGGKILESPIDLTAPYDAIQRMTIAQGQQAEQEIRIEFGAPLAVGHQVQCQFRRENGAMLDEEANLIILTLTDAGLAPATSLRVGLNQQGGTLQ